MTPPIRGLLAAPAALALGLVLASPAAQGATVRSRSGATAHVSAAAARPLQCVVNRLEASGYPIKFMGGYRRHGSVRGSLHPLGLALDINQVARGVTIPRMPRSEIAIARSCGVISGAVWCNNDSGHFQVGGWGGGACHGHRRGHHRHKHHRRHRR